MVQQRQSTPVAVSNAQWARLAPLLMGHEAGPALLDPRALVSGMLYRALTGCAWDALPQGYPAAGAVKDAYFRWRRLGLLDRISAELLVQLADLPGEHVAAGPAPQQPSRAAAEMHTLLHLTTAAPSRQRHGPSRRPALPAAPWSRGMTERCSRRR